MRSGGVMAMVVILGLAGCATVRDSRLNPGNWFGSSGTRTEAFETAGSGATVAETSGLRVARLTGLHLERMAGGAILRAVGLPATQGYHEAALVLSSEGQAGELIYDFLLRPPETPGRAGNPGSREVQVAVFLSAASLEQLRQITVRGATNALSVRR